ncbi:hypothetical protein QR680_016141 [Steinernema hermaphroditum]|uniref:Uncharacterized protein n=1 Tax=Steinernema hermaphroditum TaxID=289476 RepID=A0AA39LM41_9BILA|nr:hypothetical protein QR680_016141 [Steinernema hermaphroditum]
MSSSTEILTNFDIPSGNAPLATAAEFEGDDCEEFWHAEADFVKEQQALAEAKAKERALRKGIPMSDDETMEDEEAIVSDEQGEEEEEEVESEYPELDNTAATENSVEEDSYDFSVMDTEVDNGETAPKKKKTSMKRKKSSTKTSFKKKRVA